MVEDVHFLLQEVIAIVGFESEESISVIGCLYFEGYLFDFCATEE